MTRTAAELMLERETRVAYGTVLHSLSEEPLPESSWQLCEDQFLLRGEGDHYFHYERGHGVRIERGAGAAVTEESLWLNGSVYAAIASINGLFPIHASAVACDGKVFAFTAPAGGGKSTIVAALGAHGLPMFCDDTLVLDLSDPDRIMCLPGHKRLKLTPNALTLTGVEPCEKVSATVDKLYAVPRSGEIGEALPLRELIFLEEGKEPEMLAVSGADRLMLLQDDHYTARLFLTARQFSRVDQFTHLVRLARQIGVTIFRRPMDRSRFIDGVEFTARHITGSAERART